MKLLLPLMLVPLLLLLVGMPAILLPMTEIIPVIACIGLACDRDVRRSTQGRERYKNTLANIRRLEIELGMSEKPDKPDELAHKASANNWPSIQVPTTNYATYSQIPFGLFASYESREWVLE